MANGIVKWFSEKRSYGFIEQKDGHRMENGGRATLSV